MRCLACDKRLNDSEATRKYASTGSFVDLCNRCFAYVAEDIPDIEDGVSSGGPEEGEEGEEDTYEGTSGWYRYRSEEE